jgi:hypothetical protein
LYVGERLKFLEKGMMQIHFTETFCQYQRNANSGKGRKAGGERTAQGCRLVVIGVLWLQERRVSYYLSAYAHMGSRSWLVVSVIHLLSVILPVRWRRIPKVFSKPAPLDDAAPRPAIIFSRGLTGTGQEHSLVLVAWASLGFLVVSVNHTDGSSSLVRLPVVANNLDYAKAPLDNDYDSNFRPNQVEHRSKEILQACYLIESIHEFYGFVAAGFSFGAASAARVQQVQCGCSTRWVVLRVRMSSGDPSSPPAVSHNSGSTHYFIRDVRLPYDLSQNR